MIKKLQYKFIRISMAAVTAVLLLLGLIINIVNFISVNSEKNELLVAISNNEGRVPDFKHGEEPFDRKTLDSQFTPETPYSTRFFVLRYDDNGTLTQSDLKSIASVSEEEIPAYLAVAVEKGEGFGYFSGFRYYAVKNGEGKNMAVFLDCYDDIRTMETMAVMSMLSILGCIALVFIIVVLASGKAIKPALQTVEKQKQFITDAGHELKTPITVISTSLSVLEMEVGEQHWIDKAKAQTEKLRELVNKLVTLSKLDEEQSPLQFAPFDISAAVTETADSFKDCIDTKGVSFQLEVPAEIRYTGDEYSIRQLISILMDNAVKYTSEGEIRLSMEHTKKSLLIKLSNPCEPLDPEKLARLFDRFYRPDESRSSATGGFGIGLSIARSIAEGHGGRIKAENAPDRRIQFTVELPIHHGMTH